MLWAVELLADIATLGLIVAAVGGVVSVLFRHKAEAIQGEYAWALSDIVSHQVGGTRRSVAVLRFARGVLGTMFLNARGRVSAKRTFLFACVSTILYSVATYEIVFAAAMAALQGEVAAGNVALRAFGVALLQASPLALAVVYLVVVHFLIPLPIHWLTEYVSASVLLAVSRKARRLWPLVLAAFFLPIVWSLVLDASIVLALVARGQGWAEAMRFADTGIAFDAALILWHNAPANVVAILVTLARHIADGATSISDSLAVMFGLVFIATAFSSIASIAVVLVAIAAYSRVGLNVLSVLGQYAFAEVLTWWKLFAVFAVAWGLCANLIAVERYRKEPGSRPAAASAAPASAPSAAP